MPNFPPYQLATGKNGNPLAVGKPFVNNFLPNGGDMLRLNMAVPVTSRNDPNFSSLGLIQAAVLGLTDPNYNTTTDLEFIPNMDGFPNGRRLEDDVTRIELQAVSGAVLAAIGLWYDDYTAGDPNPVTQDLLDVLTYTTGVEENDKDFSSRFPYLAMPWAGDDECAGTAPNITATSNQVLGMNLTQTNSSTAVKMMNYPNPFQESTTIQYRLESDANIQISIFDRSGQLITNLVNSYQSTGIHEINWNAASLPAGVYFAKATDKMGNILHIQKLVKGN